MASIQRLSLVIESLALITDYVDRLAMVFAAGFSAGVAAGFALGFLFSALQQRGD